MDDQPSVDAVRSWTECFERTITISHFIFVIGNKNDLLGPAVDSLVMKEWCLQQEYNFFKTSSAPAPLIRINACFGCDPLAVFR
jgi:hypothetical protein